MKVLISFFKNVFAFIYYSAFPNIRAGAHPHDDMEYGTTITTSLTCTPLHHYITTSLHHSRVHMYMCRYLDTLMCRYVHVSICRCVDV